MDAKPDTLTGGSGADTFKFVGTGTAGTGDTILDFAVSEDKVSAEQPLWSTAVLKSASQA